MHLTLGLVKEKHIQELYKIKNIQEKYSQKIMNKKNIYRCKNQSKIRSLVSPATAPEKLVGGANAHQDPPQAHGSL